MGCAVRPGSCWSFAFSPCAPALELAVALRGLLDLSHVLSEGKLSPWGFLCSQTCWWTLPFAPEAQSKKLVVGGKHQALPHMVWFTLLLCPAWSPTWLWHVVQKYSAARGFSREGFALPWLWAFLALVNSVPPGCCSDQLYSAVKTAQASLSNLIISSDWRALSFCDMKWKCSGPRAQRGSC